jgi:hypothetical protein
MLCLCRTALPLPCEFTNKITLTMFSLAMLQAGRKQGSRAEAAAARRQQP